MLRFRLSTPAASLRIFFVSGPKRTFSSSESHDGLNLIPSDTNDVTSIPTVDLSSPARIEDLKDKTTLKDRPTVTAAATLASNSKTTESEVPHCCFKISEQEERNRNGRTLLHFAAARNDIEAVVAFLRNGADIEAVDDYGQTALFCAGSNALPVLLEWGANVKARDNSGQTPLHFARNVDSAKALIAKGADIAAVCNKKQTPLHKAAYMNRLPVIEYLIEKGADVKAVDHTGVTPLHCAASDRWYDVSIEGLIAKGADVAAADAEGKTPLHWAAERGHASNADALIAGGANIEAVDKKGRTPLHLAAGGWGSYWTVPSLLEKGASVKAADKEGCTPLHFPTCSVALEALIAKGADVNAVDLKGRTPLHAYAAEGYGSFRHEIEALIKKGANVRAVNAVGQTPLMAFKQTASHSCSPEDRLAIIALLDPTT